MLFFTTERALFIILSHIVLVKEACVNVCGSTQHQPTLLAAPSVFSTKVGLLQVPCNQHVPWEGMHRQSASIIFTDKHQMKYSHMPIRESKPTEVENSQWLHSTGVTRNRSCSRCVEGSSVTGGLQDTAAAKQHAQIKMALSTAPHTL